MTQNDFIIADAPGEPIRQDLQAALQALAQCSSGATEPATLYPGMLWLDTTVLPDGVLKMRDQANAAWLTIIPGTPAKASSGEVIAGTDDSKYATPKGIADAALVAPNVFRNRLGNPAMQINQGTDGSTLISGNYPCDQWLMSYVGGAHGCGRASLITPRKSPRRLRWTVLTAKPALATGDYFGWFQRIEGSKVADFAWGAAGAKQVIVRFGFKGPAGTYALALRNGAYNRTYVVPFTITAAQAGTDTEQVFVIPGDVTGTWTVDNTIGIAFTVCMAAGTTFVTPTSFGWVAGNFLAATGVSNGMAATGVFEIFDLGLYVDAFNLGVAPLWEMPDEPSELIACQRYYVANCYTYFNGYMNSPYTQFALGYTPVDMVVQPTYAGVNVGTPVAFPSAVSAPVSLGRVIRDFRVSNAVNANASFMTNFACSARL